MNLSLSWVIALACARGLTQERGVFLRTPKFRGSAAVRELRLVWVESALGAAAVVLLVLVLGRAGFAPVGLVLAGLLAWVLLIYGSAVGFALGDPTRAPIGAGLRQKMVLEVAPRIGRVARSRPARAGLAGTVAASLALVVVIASESGRGACGRAALPRRARGTAARPDRGDAALVESRTDAIGLPVFVGLDSPRFVGRVRSDTGRRGPDTGSADRTDARADGPADRHARVDAATRVDADSAAHASRGCSDAARSADPARQPRPNAAPATEPKPSRLVGCGGGTIADGPPVGRRRPTSKDRAGDHKSLLRCAVLS